jgi:hypothetical protein
MIRDSMADPGSKDEADAEREKSGGLSRSVQKIDVESAAPTAGDMAETAIKTSSVSSSICHQP